MTALEPAPQTSPQASEQPEEKSGFLRRLSPLGKVLSGAIAAISFVTGVIAIVPILTRDATNFDSLQLGASLVGGDLVYAVPTTTDFASFPVGSPGVCDAEQQAWLAANGDPITTSYLIDLRNVAAEGAMLSVNRFRGVGEASADDPLIKVVCDPTGASPDNLQAARLLVSDPFQVAYFDKSAFGQTQEGVPDSPVAWNLAPGEVGQIVMTLFPTLSFTGQLEATVTSGTEERDFPIVIEESETISVPGLIQGGVSFLSVDGGLNCIQIEGAEHVPCDLAGLIGK